MSINDPNASASPPGQISAPARIAIGYVITNALTYAAARGWISSDQVGPVGSWLLEGLPFVLAAAHTAYTYWNNRMPAQVARVQAMPGVQVVTTSQAVKDAVPEATKAVPGQAITVTVPKV